MNIHCLGISHRTAPIEIREKLWFSADEMRSALPAFMEGHCSEAMLVSTCNRTELYFVPGPGGPNGEPFWKALSGLKRAGPEVREEHFYALSSSDAVNHLFAVATGIDSMVLGDVQILGQIKEAFAAAQELQCTGPVLNRLCTSALHIGKRAKTETEISEGAVSVSYAAAELASKIFEDLGRRTALLIGAGETAELTAKHLAGRKIGKLLIANRTHEHAAALAGKLGGEVARFDNLLSEIERADIIISSVNAPAHILSAADLRTAMKARGSRPLFIIDIGVPRNIDPEANKIGNIFLNDIDGLTHIIDRNVAHRAAEIPRVEAIISAETQQFLSWYRSLEVTPTIQQLREQFEEIRVAEVEKHAHQFAPDKREALDLLTRRIVNKILHAPTVNLKNGHPHVTGEETRHRIRLVRTLFGLDKHAEE